MYNIYIYVYTYCKLNQNYIYRFKPPIDLVKEPKLPYRLGPSWAFQPSSLRRPPFYQASAWLPCPERVALLAS